MNSFSFNQESFDFMSDDEKRIYIKSQDPKNLLNIARLSEKYEEIIRDVYNDEFALEVLNLKFSSKITSELETMQGDVFTSVNSFKMFALLNQKSTDFFVIRVINVVSTQIFQASHTITFGEMKVASLDFVNFQSEDTSTFELNNTECRLVNCAGDYCVVKDEEWFPTSNVSLSFFRCKFDERFDNSTFNKKNFRVRFEECFFEDGVHLECGECNVTFTSCNLTQEKFMQLIDGVTFNNLVMINVKEFEFDKENLKKMQFGTEGRLYFFMRGNFLVTEYRGPQSLDRMDFQSDTFPTQEHDYIKSPIQKRKYSSFKEEVEDLMSIFNLDGPNAENYRQDQLRLVEFIEHHHGDLPFEELDRMLFKMIADNGIEDMRVSMFFGTVLIAYKDHDEDGMNSSKRARL